MGLRNGAGALGSGLSFLDIGTSGHSGPGHALSWATAAPGPRQLPRNKPQHPVTSVLLAPGSHPKQGVQAVHPRSLATPWPVSARKGVHPRDRGDLPVEHHRGRGHCTPLSRYVRGDSSLWEGVSGAAGQPNWKHNDKCPPQAHPMPLTS